MSAREDSESKIESIPASCRAILSSFSLASSLTLQSVEYTSEIPLFQAIGLKISLTIPPTAKVAWAQVGRASYTSVGELRLTIVLSVSPVLRF